MPREDRLQGDRWQHSLKIGEKRIFIAYPHPTPPPRNLPSHQFPDGIGIRQVPFLLLFITGLFSFPFLAYSLSLILGGKDADGKFFCLFLGFLILWSFLEFVATRERIEIEQDAKVLHRSVTGVFRHRRQMVYLRDVTSITLESKMQSTGTKNVRRQYLYMDGQQERFLLNSPAKVYLDHRKLGKILCEVTRIPPYRELRDGEEVSTSGQNPD